MKELILKKITEEDIFQRYFPETVALGRYYRNPWRADKNPKCYFTKRNDKLFFVDWADDPTHQDCFLIAQKATQTARFQDTLNQISKDFNLGLHRPISLDDFVSLDSVTTLAPAPILYNKDIIKDEKTIIKVGLIPFIKNDLEYWGQYGITEETLLKYDVRACYKAWINDELYHTYRTWDPMYSYKEKNGMYKLYRPFVKNKAYKWRTNMSGGILEGWEQLPSVGPLLFITKSRKDVMTLYELGYPAIACRSESTLISSNALELLKERFGKIIVWYDNDEIGVKYSTKLTEQYDFLYYFNIPKGLPKDPSDFYKEKGRETFLKLIANATYKKTKV